MVNPNGNIVIGSSLLFIIEVLTLCLVPRAGVNNVVRFTRFHWAQNDNMFKVDQHALSYVKEVLSETHLSLVCTRLYNLLETLGK